MFNVSRKEVNSKEQNIFLCSLKFKEDLRKRIKRFLIENFNFERKNFEKDMNTNHVCHFPKMQYISLNSFLSDFHFLNSQNPKNRISAY